MLLGLEGFKRCLQKFKFGQRIDWPPRRGVDDKVSKIRGFALIISRMVDVAIYLDPQLPFILGMNTLYLNFVYLFCSKGGSRKWLMMVNKK